MANLYAVLCKYKVSLTCELSTKTLRARGWWLSWIRGTPLEEVPFSIVRIMTFTYVECSEVYFMDLSVDALSAVDGLLCTQHRELDSAVSSEGLVRLAVVSDNDLQRQFDGSGKDLFLYGVIRFWPSRRRRRRVELWGARENSFVRGAGVECVRKPCPIEECGVSVRFLDIG
jgi:hypothetical protein